MMSEKEERVVIGKKFIDLEQVFNSKNPNILKWMPGFIFRYLKNIIHVDEINEFLYKYRDAFGLDFIDAIVEHYDLKIESEGLENIPETGKQIVVSNHPLGGFDGVALFHEAKKIRKDIKFPVNDILLNLPQSREIVLPINKHGRNIENFKILDENFDKEQLLLFFPAGLVSRKQKGVIKDLEWKHTFINRAKRHKRNVIPAYVEGRNSDFFYNFANLRKKLGIKANIEMLYLPNEMFKSIGSNIKVKFGEEIPYETFDKSKSAKEWAAWVKEKAYDLK